jgi:RNA ligase
VEDGTGKVIARGPSKFMNYGDPKAPAISMDSEVIVTRKEDGSLGIGWTYDGHYGVATRGSFTSEQAKHATAMLREYDKAIIANTSSKGQTEIWEIVYPENRIVLDYGDRDELISLGTVRNKTGLIFSRYIRTMVRMRSTFADALALQVPDDEEGYVLDVLQNGDTVAHIKLKGETYKILHGLLTNTNARRIWVQLAARDCHWFIEKPEDWAHKLGHDPADFARVDVEKDLTETLLTNVPDEFYTWVTKQIDSINDKVSDLIIQSIALAGQISLIGDKRARFEIVKSHPMCKEILALASQSGDFDLSMITAKAWKLAKPAGDETPFKTQEED